MHKNQICYIFLIIFFKINVNLEWNHQKMFYLFFLYKNCEKNDIIKIILSKLIFWKENIYKTVILLKNIIEIKKILMKMKYIYWNFILKK